MLSCMTQSSQAMMQVIVFEFFESCCEATFKLDKRSEIRSLKFLMERNDCVMADQD